MTMNDFVLDDPSYIPDDICDKLRPFKRLATDPKSKSIDDLLQVPEFKEAADLLDQRIQEGHVHAYHCTRELSVGFFKGEGLRNLSMGEHHKWVEEIVEDKVSMKRTPFGFER